MPPYNYDEHIARLIQQEHTIYESVFFYDGVPLEQHYSDYFQFCQENMDTMNLQHQIRPASVYFNWKRTIGARAMKKNGYYSVSINTGTIHAFHELFREHFTIDRHIPEGELLNLNETPLQYVMYQVAVLFLYYHELAHLIQMSDEDRCDFNEDFPLNEPVAGYSREQHLREMDADLFAAQYICDHILHWVRDHPTPSAIDLRNYTTAAIAALFALFLKSQGRPQPLYFEEHAHPHLMIRITYVQDYIIRRLGEIKPQHIAFHGQEVMRGFITGFHPRVLAVFPGYNLSDYAQAIVDNQQRIEDFVIRMFHDSLEFPDLVINRQRRARQQNPT